MASKGKSDTRAWDAMLRRVKQMSGHRLAVGIVEEKQHEESGLTMAELGAIHEYGAPSVGIEARPWLGSTFRNRRKELADQAHRVMKVVLNGRGDAVRALRQVGEFAATAVKRAIFNKLIKQDLSPATLKHRKALGRGDAALMDTDSLYDAIGYKIDKIR